MRKKLKKDLEKDLRHLGYITIGLCFWIFVLNFKFLATAKSGGQAFLGFVSMVGLYFAASSAWDKIKP